ncbi:MAG: tetratricopeptide repeat protein [Tepidisphaeraceae bacterium]|jgi:tetratricopeptide repeat protein
MRSATSSHCVAKDAPQHAASSPSACVLDLWDQGMDRHDSCAAALARLIVAQPERVVAFADPAVAESCLRAELKQDLATAKPSNVPFWLSAIAQFLDWQGRAGEAVELYRQTLDVLKTARGPDHAETCVVANELGRLLRRLGREREACLIGHELRVGPLLTRTDQGSLSALRDAAYEAFSAGCFAEAQAICRHLLVRNFDPVSTHCHLARALLAQGRDADAAAEVNVAWQCRPGAESYVIARVLFLQALLATLAAQDAQTPLTMLKELLQQNPRATHSWLMKPVLDLLQPRLTPQSHEFFTRLAGEMSGSSTE